MFDSVRIKAGVQQSALELAEQVPAYLRPTVAEEDGGWEVRVETESEDDLPDLLAVLRARLPGADPAVEVIVNGETYPLRPSY
ncbi:MAG TPA: hypothetical protein VLV28_08500 [Gaiellaceae bacterium]|nr:hypothetical protein [Gaiellaceae bacterium]